MVAYTVACCGYFSEDFRVGLYVFAYAKKRGFYIVLCEYLQSPFGNLGCRAVIKSKVYCALGIGHIPNKARK